MVPWMIVPMFSLEHVWMGEAGKGRAEMGNRPFLSSIVTVSFAHFIRNLPSNRVSQSFVREP
jgi:hypothetical protein